LRQVFNFNNKSAKFIPAQRRDTIAKLQIFKRLYCNPMITTIAFDADDTLWHNERIFLDAKVKLKSLLAEYQTESWIDRHLDKAETHNIKHFGYGVKAFTLSMIETACELSDGKITGSEILEIIGFARIMLATSIELLDGVKETIHELSHKYRMMLVTKGDLFDQETKLARSGLGDYFEIVEVVANKDKATYKKLLLRHKINPKDFVMVGNSLRSDILPVLEVGGKAVHIPYETEWFHEAVSAAELHGKEFTTIEKISDLKNWLKGF
jgi:putative hydrolase of the HAD superfamily